MCDPNDPLQLGDLRLWLVFGCTNGSLVCLARLVCGCVCILRSSGFVVRVCVCVFVVCCSWLTRFACADAALARLVLVCVGWSCCRVCVCGLFCFVSVCLCVIKPSALSPPLLCLAQHPTLISFLLDHVLPHGSSTRAFRVLHTSLH